MDENQVQGPELTTENAFFLIITMIKEEVEGLQMSYFPELWRDNEI